LPMLVAAKLTVGEAAKRSKLAIAILTRHRPVISSPMLRLAPDQLLHRKTPKEGRELFVRPVPA